MTRPWTYGCEHELGDWYRGDFHKLGEGWGIDENDVTVMNTQDGIAADPKGVLFEYGGEINTPPTELVTKQGDYLRWLKKCLPAATVNHRSNLHVHIRIPGLKDDLETLKRIANYGFLYLPGPTGLLEFVEPIPKPTPDEYPIEEEFKGAMRRYKRRLVSHHTVITEARWARQQKATTVEEFFAAECPMSKGKPQWHLAPRHAVNLRHLREPIDTIEFRHFPGTLDENLLTNCVRWCGDYIAAAMSDAPPARLRQAYKDVPFPKFPPYVHWLEVNYRKTCHDGTLTKSEIEENIERILNG